jgi:hypothetical protein
MNLKTAASLSLRQRRSITLPKARSDHRWFRADAGVGSRQRACGKPDRQTVRRQKTQASWRRRNPGHAIAWRIDQRAAQTQPETWRIPPGSASHAGSAGCWRRWLAAASTRPSLWWFAKTTANVKWKSSPCRMEKSELNLDCSPDRRNQLFSRHGAAGRRLT